MTVYGGLQTGYRKLPPGYLMVDGERFIDRIVNIIELQRQFVEEVGDLLDMIRDATAREKEEIGI